MENEEHLLDVVEEAQPPKRAWQVPKLILLNAHDVQSGINGGLEGSGMWTVS